MAIITSDLIPSAVAQQLIGEVYTQSTVLAQARVQSMPAGVTHIPVIGARPVAAFVTGVGGKKPHTTMEFTATQIVAEEVAAIVTVPQAYIDDAGFPLWDNVRPLVAEAIAKAIDAAVLFGTGAPATFPVGGVLANSTAAAMPAGGDYASQVSAAMGLVEAGGYFPTGHIADVTVRAKLRDLRGPTGGPIYTPSLTAAMPEALYGLPIRFTQPGVMDLTETTGAEFFTGDWSKLIIGVRQDLRFDTSTDATIDIGGTLHSMFQEDSVAMRAFMRLGCVIAKFGTADPWAHIAVEAEALAARQAATRKS